MRTVILARTRSFFGIDDGSIFAAIETPIRQFFSPAASASKNGSRTGSKPPRKNSYWLASVILAPAVLGIAYEPWKDSVNLPVESERRPVVAARSVTIGRPTQTATASVALPATFRPWQTTTIHARVSGYLAAWNYDLGTRVKAGDIMAEIDTPELDQELATAVAQVAEANAATGQAKAERVEAEADLKVAEAQLARVQAEVSLAKSQLVRRAELLSRKVISQEDYDTFSTQVETRAAEVASAESEIARRRKNLDTRTAIIDVREATSNSRQANVDRLRELQAFKHIVAPFDGVVTRRLAELGMLVTTDQSSLFIVEDLDRIRVQVSVPQTYAMQMKSGDTATVRIPESRFGAVEGTISRIAQSVDSGSRTMLAEIDLANSSRQFQPGIYAQVILSSQQNNELWTIPTNTVSMRVEGPHVAIVNDQNQIELKRLTLGRDLGNRVVVTEGIVGSEKLVVNPTDDLVQGLQVEVNERASGGEVARRE